MKHFIHFLVLAFYISSTSVLSAQKPVTATNELSSDFHKNRREALRALLPENSVAVFFANPIRNRSNDVDYHYHQDPNFFYLTGYEEPHAMLLLFKEKQFINGGETNELIFVQEKNELQEMWTGKRLGVAGTKEQLGFTAVFQGKAFQNFPIDFSLFDTILFNPLFTDVRDTTNEADLYSLQQHFKDKVSLQLQTSTTNEKMVKQTTIDKKSLQILMAELREQKTPEELTLLKKAISISVVGQQEIMKAMHPDMSEREIQGIHEFVYKKYGAAHEGYPSIVGAGANSCILHYVENSTPMVGNSLILMDLGAEYNGYTADITRTIPANGKFSEEEKIIYELVLKAQNAGIKEAVVGNHFSAPTEKAREVINEGLAQLGIISTKNTPHLYFPHGASHHIGLDVHDASNYGPFKEDMVITVEPGIYIPANSNCDPKWWNIGVRIEDDILITKNGPLNLSEKAPRTVEAIEKLMKEDSVLSNFVLPTID